MRKRLLPLLLITLLLTTGAAAGCGSKDNLDIPVSELSLPGLWQDILKVTGASGNETHLQSFEIRFKDNNVEYYTASFADTDTIGTPTYFSFYTYPDGKPHWSGNYMDTNIPEQRRYNPEAAFAELERYGMEALVDGARTAGIRITSKNGKADYDWNNIYRLNNGTIQPLADVTYDTDEPWAEIWIPRAYSDEQVDTFFFGKFKSMGDWLFTGADLARASSVVAAKNQQDDAFKAFLKDIFTALPEGWEMSLMTHEGSMNPPSAMEEPLFRLSFTDTLHTFSISNDPTNTDLSPKLILYMYDTAEKDKVMQTIEQQSIYSWDIPEYFDENSRYIAVTSPLAVNSGWHSEEAMDYLLPLQEALHAFFKQER